ncbi:hypothetical protein [Pseudomonas sp. 24 E 13]|nr:hypothetical protein [Pseudomonas sp. 24 E 13]
MHHQFAAARQAKGNPITARTQRTVQALATGDHGAGEFGIAQLPLLILQGDGLGILHAVFGKSVPGALFRYRQAFARQLRTLVERQPVQFGKRHVRLLQGRHDQGNELRLEALDALAPIQRLAVTPAPDELGQVIDDHQVQFVGRTTLLANHALDVALERHVTLLVQREHVLEHRCPAHLPRQIQMLGQAREGIVTMAQGLPDSGRHLLGPLSTGQVTAQTAAHRQRVDQIARQFSLLALQAPATGRTENEIILPGQHPEKLLEQ